VVAIVVPFSVGYREFYRGVSGRTLHVAASGDQEAPSHLGEARVAVPILARITRAG
jgi:hypothetical protein